MKWIAGFLLLSISNIMAGDYDHDVAQCMSLRAYLLILQLRIEEAEAQYREVIAAFPGSPEARFAADQIKDMEDAKAR